MDEETWNRTAKGLLRAELRRRDMTYAELAERLAPLGLIENANSIAKKINRGRFPAAFLLASFRAIGCKSIPLGDDDTMTGNEG